MNKQQSRMINKAIKDNTDSEGVSKISWCPGGMFTVVGKMIFLWYNDAAESTHVIKEEVKMDKSICLMCGHQIPTERPYACANCFAIHDVCILNGRELIKEEVEDEK